MIAVLLIGSILAQICAVVVSCKLMRITRRRLVWVLFCAAVFLMVIRRCLSLFELTFGSPPGIPSLEVEVVAFLVSVLMAVGLSLLIPIFKSWQESEDASREGELRFRQLCEAAFEGVVIHAEGLVLDANPRFAALFGYAPSEVVGKAVIDFVSHDTKGLVLSHFRDSADEPFEYEAVRKDGSVFAVEACSRPTSFGGRAARVTVVRDITERQRAETALRESQRTLSTLMSNLPGMAYRCRNDSEWTMEFVSEGCLELTGYSAVDLLESRKASFGTLIHPDDRARLWGEVQCCLKRRELFRLKYRIQTATGEEKWVWEHGAGVFDKQGNVEALEGFITDISEPHRAEQELVAAERRLNHLVSKSPAIIYSCGQPPDYPTTFISDNVQAQLGHAPRAFYDDPFFWSKQIHPDDRREVMSSLEEIGDRESVVYEYRLQHADGRYRWLHDEVAVVRGDDGAIGGLIGSWFDVTARREAEEGLRHAREELETRVALRTADLTQTNARLQEEISERRRIEAALRESESRFRSLSESAPIGIFLTDAEGTCTFANEYFLTLCGLPAEEIFAQGWYRSVHPQDYEAVMRGARRAIESDEPFSGEFRIQRPNGEVRWAFAQTARLAISHGERTGLVGTVRDITARKSVEVALARHSADLKRLTAEQDILLQNTRDFIYHHDVEGVFTYVSPSALQITGYTPDDWKKHYTAYLTDNPINQNVIANTEETLRTGTECPPYLVEIRHREGRTVTLEVSERPHREEGRIVGIIGVARDVTDRVRAEASLRDSEQRLQGVLDNTTAVVYVKDLVGRYQMVNRRFEGLFHVTRGQIVGKTDYDVFPKETADAFRTNDLRVITSCAPVEFEETVPLDDGMHTYISLKFPLLDADGVPYAACGISTDITERKAAARELQRAKEGAEAANRTKTTFLANMSHEIRTPITAMLGAAELLASDQSDVTRHVEHVDMILRNGRHLLALIDDLLDLSRVEAGQQELRRQRSPLLEIMADVQAVTEPLHTLKDVEYRIVYESPVPEEIDTDPTRLKQAIINLINNALKFTRKGFVRVRVAADRSAARPELRVTVEDSGSGIPAESMESIFESFTQVGLGAGDVSRGVGLGLPLARSIARQLGGDIIVASEPGRGSTFQLRVAIGDVPGLRWLQPESELIHPTATAPYARSPIERRLSGRILIADDFPDMRALVEHALRSRGAEVVAVSDGAQAVEAAADGFDLILLDIRMPVKDGLAAAREIRRAGCLTPMIALTASDTVCDRSSILGAGFDDLWGKPITLIDLVERVAAYLPSRLERLRGRHSPSASTDKVDLWESRIAAARRAYAADLPTRIEELAEAAAKQDNDTVREILHQLIGSSGIHGFDEFSGESVRLYALSQQAGYSVRPDDLELLKRLAAAAGAGMKATPVEE